MLKGERIGLRPLQTEDVWMLYGWSNDREVLEDLGRREGFFCTSMEEERKAVETMLASRNERHFLMVDLEDNKGLGIVSLRDIDERNASAGLRLVVGEKSAWGKGLVKEALGLILAFSFRQLNLHRISVRVPEYSRKMLECYKSVGFREDGVLRHDHFHRGKYADSLLLSLLREEFSC